MNRLIVAASLLLVVCCPFALMADDSEIIKEIHEIVEEINTELSENNDRRADELKEYIDKNVVERLDDLEEMVESIQARQKYFELCFNAFPCGEHGTCSVEGDKYKCTCKEGFSGEHCEEGDLCLTMECLNGGTCHSNITEDGSPMCVCNGSWYGDNCELQGPCAEALAAASEGPVLLGKPTPQCEIDGFYSPIQYQGSVAFCVTQEGEELKGYSMNRWEANENTTCNCARDEHTARAEMDDRPFSCLKNGSYAPFICIKNRCFCQDPYGEVDESTGVHRRARRRLRCPGMKGWKKMKKGVKG